MRFSISALCLVLLLSGCGGEATFDAATWKAERGVYCDNNKVPHERKAMVGDLLDRHLRVGTTTRSVRSLLGAPDHTERSARGLWWSYDTGNDKIDCVSLEILFRRGLLVEAREGQS